MENEESTINKKLPTEIWRKIFGFVPKKYRENIPLVNSLFYAISCDMKKDDRTLTITKDNVSSGG